MGAVCSPTIVPWHPGKPLETTPGKAICLHSWRSWHVKRNFQSKRSWRTTYRVHMCVGRVLFDRLPCEMVEGQLKNPLSRCKSWWLLWVCINWNQNNCFFGEQWQEPVSWWKWQRWGRNLNDQSADQVFAKSADQQNVILSISLPALTIKIFWFYNISWSEWSVYKFITFVTQFKIW